MVDVVTGAEQAQFLAGEGQKQNAALVFGLAREPARQFDDARGAGGVVVGAGMHGSSERGRHGKLLAQAEMIVVRADDDVLAGFAGKVGGDVVDRFHFAPDVDVHVEMQCCRAERTIPDAEFLSMSLSMASRFLPLRASQWFTTVGLHLHELDAGVVRARGGAEFLQIVGVAGMRADVVDQQHRLGAVNLGVGGLAEDLRVRGVDLAFKHALVVELLRLVTQQQNDLALHVEARVVVVIVFGSGDAEARKDHVAGNLAGGGKIQRDEILLEPKRFRCARRCYK